MSGSPAISPPLDSPARRGACPTLAAPMETGDGLLARFALAEGGLSPDRLVALAEAAERFGNGVVEVTARGSLQVRGLRPDTVAPFGAVVASLGLPLRSGVPVETSPLAGLDPTELADPRPLAARLREELAHAGLEACLAPKVTVVVDGGGKGWLRPLKADVRLAAIGPQRWRVSVATRDGEAGLGCGDAETALQAALRILTAVASLGPATRAADLEEETRLKATAGLCLEEVLLASPCEDEDVVGIHHLTDGSVARGIGLAFGQAEAAALIALAQAAAVHGIADIRPAPGRALFALSFSPAQAERFADEASRLGFVIAADDPRRSIVACPGAPACASGRIAARALAPALADALSRVLDGAQTVHVSGCEKGCAHRGPAALTIVGLAEGCGIVLNGTPRSVPISRLQPEALLAALERGKASSWAGAGGLARHMRGVLAQVRDESDPVVRSRPAQEESAR